MMPYPDSMNWHAFDRFNGSRPQWVRPPQYAEIRLKAAELDALLNALPVESQHARDAISEAHDFLTECLRDVEKAAAADKAACEEGYQP